MPQELQNKSALIWFKNDLRLHDNEALCNAVASGLPLLFLYCIDSRSFRDLDLGFKKANINGRYF